MGDATAGASGPLIVAIDGPSGVGKSTVARRVAARLGIPFLETGAMYRALGLRVFEGGADPDDRERVAGIAAELDLELEIAAGGAEAEAQVRVLLDGRPLDRAAHGLEVSEITSRVSTYPEVRQRMVDLQRRAARRTGAVMEGRDIGTKVFPETPHKFFLAADLDERVRRRWAQLRGAAAGASSPEEVRRDLVDRDRRDSTRSDSPLVCDASYVRIDTSRRTIDEVVEEIVRRVRTPAPPG